MTYFVLALHMRNHAKFYTYCSHALAAATPAFVENQCLLKKCKIMEMEPHIYIIYTCNGFEKSRASLVRIHKWMQNSFANCMHFETFNDFQAIQIRPKNNIVRSIESRRGDENRSLSAITNPMKMKTTLFVSILQ